MKRYIYMFMVLAFLSCKKDTKKTNPILEELVNTTVRGNVFGTTFSVIYNAEEDYSKQFDSLFTIVNQSMSTYIPDSDISRLNRNEDVVVDEHFTKVFQTSKEVYQTTNGVFDPTIGDVVNAWSFGADQNKFLTDSNTIDSLMRFVGLNKVSLVQGKVSKPKGTYIEFNAIAKGYGVDVIANFLESKHCDDYLVEIGGELRASGVNIEKEAPSNSWRVGIDRPRFDGIQDENPLQAISLKDVGMATSGTYRKFKTDENGNRYTHIINTKTGYPSKTNILSVSVIAEDCMTADAYATSFQAMGIENVRTFLKSHPELKVFLVFENENKAFETLNFNDFPER